MTDSSDLALAQLSLAAYQPVPELPPGFAALDAGSLDLPLAAGQSLEQGLFQSSNAAALLASGVVDGQYSLVLAFRGSDDREDSLNSLRDINAGYAEFQPLFAAVEAAAASGAYEQVVVTGHSLGGSLAQQFMAAHPDQPGGVDYAATTFGSPGALLPAAPDPRIENFVVADDPAVFLGAHRAEAGALLRAEPRLAQAAADRSAEVFPDLTPQEALESIPFLTANYVNRGSLVLLPTADGGTGLQDILSGLAEGDVSRHDPALYVQAVAAAQAGGARPVPDSGGDAQDALSRAVFRAEYPDGLATEPLLREVLADWGPQVEDVARDAWQQAQSGLSRLSLAFADDWF